MQLLHSSGQIISLMHSFSVTSANIAKRHTLLKLDFLDYISVADGVGLSLITLINWHPNLPNLVE